MKDAVLHVKESNAINILKAVLAIGVVLSHASFKHHDINGIDILQSATFDSFRLFIQILQSFTCVCVPLFFFISGYLFFLNIDGRFDKAFYFEKIKKRIKTLLLPYFIANVLALMFILIANSIKPNIIPIGNVSLYSISLSSLLSWLWLHPLMGPTWFLRDLFVVCLFTPVIYLLSKNRWSAALLTLVLLVILGGV